MDQTGIPCIIEFLFFNRHVCRQATREWSPRIMIASGIDERLGWTETLRDGIEPVRSIILIRRRPSVIATILILHA
jgi:hypothetical protein